MKLIYIVIPIVLVAVITFFLQQEEVKDFTKIETLINQNASELVKTDNTSNKAEDRKSSIEIASKIQSGECPANVDKKLVSYAIKNLASKTLNESESQAVVDCIETLGVQKESNYTLMVDLFSFWEKENLMLEKFYTKFFKGYKDSNPLVLGLLDNAKLMCAKAGINFLQKSSYPENVNNAMTEKEYALFLEYVDDYRCGGYAK